jgi:hypothetical protein
MLSRFFGRERLHAKDPDPDTSSTSKPLLDAFFEQLRKCLPDCFIFPNQSLISILEKHPSPYSNQTSIDCLNLQSQQLIFNFTVLDNQGKMLCLINIRSNKDQDEHENVSKLLSEMNIRYISWDIDHLPNESELAKVFPMYLHGAKTPLESTISHYSRFKHGVEQHQDSLYFEQNKHQENHNLNLNLNHNHNFKVSLSHLEQLVPHQHIKTKYPHIWQHICMYSDEPKQLKVYLNSLFEQNRPTKRKGFPSEVEQEICFIREEADRLTSKTS